jgi:hypothetical protein
LTTRRSEKEGQGAWHILFIRNKSARRIKILNIQEEIMSSNFEWEKLQTHERVQGALQDALTHRLARQGTAGRSHKSLSSKIILPLGVIWLLIRLLLSGCTPARSAYAENQSGNIQTPVFS